MRNERSARRPARPARPRAASGDLDYLLGRVAAGDAAAFAKVYDQVAGPVYGLAYSMAGEPGWSQELAAEALAEVWRTAPGYDRSEASALPWVMRIARQHIVRHVRAAGTRGQPAASPPSADAGPRGAEQQAVLLALRGGYTQDEISTRLGLTAEAVAGLIRGGLRQAAQAEPAR